MERYDVIIKSKGDPLDRPYISEKGARCPMQKAKARWKVAA